MIYLVSRLQPLFTALRRLLLLAFIFLTVSAEQFTLRNYTSRENKFSISYPDLFETLPVESPEIAFLIRDKKNLFPTFNILVLPGSYDMTQADSKHADSILDSYKLVGITDALPVKWLRFRLGDQSAFNMELKYKNQGKDLTSSVTIASASDRHYILTYIDQTRDWESNKEFRSRIIGSFTVLERSAAPASPPQPQQGGGWIIWMTILAGIPAWMFWRRKKGRRR